MENNSNSETLSLLERFKTLSTLKKAILILGILFFIYLLRNTWLPWKAEYYYRVGYGHAVRRQYQEAIKNYEIAVKAAPMETQYKIELGKQYEDFSRAQQDLNQKFKYLKKAETMYRQMVDINPENPWYQNRLAEIFNLYSKFYPQVIPVDLSNGESFFLPREALNQSLETVSVTYSQKLPNLTRTQLEKAALQADQLAQDYDKQSKEKIFYAATLDPNNPLFKMTIAYYYHRNKDFEKAIQQYDKIIAIDDQFGEAYFNKADIYIQQGKVQEAQKLYEQIIEFNPGFKNVHLMQARLKLRQGDQAGAQAELVEELKHNRNNTAAFQMLGELLYQKRDYLNASKILGRLIQLQPKNVKAIYQLGVCYVNLKKDALALAQFEKVLELVPGNPQAKQAIAFIKQRQK